MKSRMFILTAMIAILLSIPPAGLYSQAPGIRTPAAGPTPSILPKPLSMRITANVFPLASSTRILVDDGEEADRLGQYLSQEIRKSTGLILPVSAQTGASSEPKKGIVLTTRGVKGTLGTEGYELSIKPDGVRLRAQTLQGLFYGIQTIRQLLPPAAPDSGGADPRPASFNLPCVQVEDAPRFSWRGLNLDCGRHFMTKDFIKRTIDLLAAFKMNRFHWHLTEDQGWRIEIKKYPEFTRKGAWRTTEDGVVYGGFYTQDDIREVVSYAQSRYVTVIPEIEMPGHSVAALASYPELSCAGGPFEVQNYWGIHADVYCAGNEKTFEVLEGVLSEVVDLFPAPYVHVGGDECPKDRWQACPKCQARIKAEGLKDEAELQSYFIKRIEKFLLAKKRRIIGWDEILEGGLPPQATVQSWRGFEGAVAAAKSGHDTIVSPTRYAYFDYNLQTTDLRKVYAFEPIPEGLNPAARRHILGGECNMWAEYAPQETIDGKLFPRILAMAERLWSSETAKNFDEFQRRAWRQSDRLKTEGVQVGDETHSLTLVPAFSPEAKKVTVSLKPEENDLIIRYTIDGGQPTLQSTRYDSPLTIINSCLVQARAFKGDRPYGEPVSHSFAIHPAWGKPVQLKNPTSPKRPGGGTAALTDGLRGQADMGEPAWQGFEGTELEAVVDLGESRTIQTIAVGFLQDSSHGVFMPPSVEFSVSDDGTSFRPVGTAGNVMAKDNPDPTVKDFSVRFEPVPGRFVRVVARTIGVCPPGHPYLAQKAWLLADEIIVE